METEKLYNLSNMLLNTVSEQTSLMTWDDCMKMWGFCIAYSSPMEAGDDNGVHMRFDIFMEGMNDYARKFYQVRCTNDSKG